MSSDYTITIDTEDAQWSDDEIEVDLTTPGPHTQLSLVARAPDGLAGINENNLEIPPGTSEWIEKVVGEVTTFPTELLDELSPEAFNDLVDATMKTFVGENPERNNFKHEPDSTGDLGIDLDLNDDGTVDFEDWR